MPSFNNPKVLVSLPTAARGKVWAYLVIEQRTTKSFTGLGTEPEASKFSYAGFSGKSWRSQQPPNLNKQPPPYFTFLANPESIDWDRSATYTEAVTAATSIQSQQYSHTSGRKWSIPGLLMETWHEGRAIAPLIEALEALLLPDPTNKDYSPKVISFVWGDRRLGPAVLKSIKVKEEAWLSGAPASVTVDLELVEIPPPDTDPVARLVRAAEKAEGDLEVPLSDRQRTEASTEAREWLNANVSKLPSGLQDRVRSSRYALLTDAATGNVSIQDGQGNDLGVVGRWDGREFSVSNQEFK